MKAYIATLRHICTSLMMCLCVGSLAQPIVVDVSVVNADGTYTVGDIVTFEVTFDEVVTDMPFDSGGNTFLVVSMDSGNAYAVRNTIDNSAGSYSKLTFDLTLDNRHYSQSGITLVGFEQNGIKNLDDIITPSELPTNVDTAFPNINVQHGNTFTVHDMSTYIVAGEELKFSIQWRGIQSLEVTGDPLMLPLTIGTETYQLEGQLNDDTIEFNHTLSETDITHSGISLQDIQIGNTSITGIVDDTQDVIAPNRELTLSTVNTDANLSTFLLTMTEKSIANFDANIVGSELQVSVTFEPMNTSEEVVVQSGNTILVDLGDETVELTPTGTPCHPCLYSYAIQAGDVSPDGIQIKAFNINYLGFSNGGVFLNKYFSYGDEEYQFADIRLNDSMVPQIVSVTLPTDAQYYAGEEVSLTLSFDEIVTVTGTPMLHLSIGDTQFVANYSSGTASTDLIFTGQLPTVLESTSGITLSSLAVNDGTISHSTGTPADLSLPVLGDTSGIQLASATQVTSISGSPSGSYTSGQTLAFEIEYSDIVNVAGDPVLVLQLDTSTVAAQYSAGNGTNSLQFSYLIQPSDIDSDGIVPVNINSDVGTITGANGSPVSHVFPSFEPNIVIVNTAPTGYSLEFSDSMITDTNLASVHLQLTDAEVGTLYEYTISDGNTVLTGNGTVSESNQTISDFDLSSMAKGTLVASIRLVDSTNVDIRGPLVSASALRGDAVVVNDVSLPSATTYGMGTTLVFTIQTNADVYWNFGVTGQVPFIPITINSEVYRATYQLDSEPKVHVFALEVPSVNDTDGIEMGQVDNNQATPQSDLDVPIDLSFTLSSDNLQTLADIDIDDSAALQFDIATLDNTSYQTGDSLLLSLSASTNYFDINVVAPDPSLTLVLDSGEVTMSYKEATTNVVFEYVLTAQDYHSAENPIVINQADWQGNIVREFFTTSPFISDLSLIDPIVGVAVNSNLSDVSIRTVAYTADRYTDSQTFTVDVIFSDEVTVSGSPLLTIAIGDDIGEMVYASGSGTDTLTFSYTVASDENAPDGVEWQGINLDSGQLVDEAGVPITQLSQAIELNGIVIDNTAPQLMSFDKQDSAESVNDDELVWTIGFSEPIQAPATTSFSLDNSTAELAVSVSNADPSVLVITASGGDLANLDEQITLSFDNTLVVEDTIGLSAAQPETSYAQTYLLDNTPPSGHSVSWDQALINESNHAAVTAVLRDVSVGDSFNYSVTDGDDSINGSGVISDSTHMITGFDVSSLSPGTLTLSVIVTDAAGNSATAVTDTTEYNLSPVISGTPLVTVDQDANYSFTPAVADDDAVNYSVTGLPSWLSFDPQTGTLSGTPANDNVGETDLITLSVTDNVNTAVSLAGFTITVNNVNDTPVATDDSVTLNENTSSVVAAIDNDIDIDGDELSISFDSTNTQPNHGAVIINVDNTLTYQHDGSETTTDSFTYTVSDPSGETSTATVTVTIDPVNDVPTLTAAGVNSTYTEDGAAITLYTNAVADTIEATQAFTGFTLTANDIVDSVEQLSVDGSVISLSTDSTGNTLTSGLSYTVSLLNGEATVTFGDGALSAVALASIIEGIEYSNTSDNPTTATSRSITLTQIMDNGGTANGGVATANISVAANIQLVASNDSASFSGDSTVTVVSGETALTGALAVSDVDNGESVFIAQTDIAEEYGTFTIATDGAWQFEVATDNAEYVALSSDESIQQVIDITSADGTATTLTITITGINDAPVATGDSVTLDENANRLIAVLSNDTDVDGDTLSLNNVTAPTNGSVVMNPDGTITYQHDGSETTSDNFSYTINDPSGAQATGLVTVTIQPINDSPIATNDSVTLNEGGAVNINVMDNDTDAEGDILTSVIAVTPINGTATVNQDGTVSYQHDGSETATDSFTYTVSDPSGAQDTATVDISVNAVNDIASIFGANSFTITEDDMITLTGSLTISDNDIGETIFEVVENEAGTYGDFSISENGEWIYRLRDSGNNIQFIPRDIEVTDTFEVKSLDNTANHFITITITGVNGAAVITGSSSGSTVEDSTVIVTGNLSISDEDEDEARFVEQPEISVSYGVFTLNQSGEWTYTLDTSNSAVQALPINASLNDSFVATSVDGSSSRLVTVTIVGQNDTATITGVNSGSVVEDSPTILAGVLNVEDLDTGETLFTEQVATTGSFGYFSIASDGHWQYSLDNTNSTVQALPAGETLTENFVTRSIDGTATQSVVITIYGQNDVPSVTGVTTGVISEDATSVLSGELVISDIDTGESGFIEQTDEIGLFGWFTISVEGIWEYMVDTLNSLVLSLTTSQTLEDNFEVVSTDGSVVEVVTAIIEGDNDLAIFDGSFAGDVAEDSKAMVSGEITVVDIDGSNVFVASTIMGQFGTLNVNAQGEWQYQLEQMNEDVQQLAEGQSLVESFTLVAADGSQTQVNVTVNGENDRPVATDDAYQLIRSNNDRYILDVLLNDTDSDDVALTLTQVQSSIGQAFVIENKIQFEAEPYFYGEVKIDYSISDNGGLVSRATAIVSIDNPLSEGPTITAPADIYVNATGLLTRIDLGIAQATDALGRNIAVTLLGDNKVLFEPGRHLVYWSATDEMGNTGYAEQVVSVAPMVSLGKNRRVAEGTEQNIDVILNGNSPIYPLTIPFTVSGSAGGTDHTLIDGSVVISEGTVASIPFSILNDQEVDPDEVIVVTLGGTVNRAPQFVTRYTIDEGNMAPTLSVLITQNGEQRSQVTRDAGDVTIAIDAQDPNSDDTLSIQWQTHVTPVRQIENGLILAIDDLNVGLHEISVTVTDNGFPSLSTTKTLNFTVVETSSVLSIDSDSDGDLIPDRLEGIKDSDGDGIPDYLDGIDFCNVMPANVTEQTLFLSESEAGICLRMGATALAGETGGLAILPNKNSDSDSDPDYRVVNHLYDFLVEGSVIFDQPFYIVLPQDNPIPSDAVYRKFDRDLGWTDFVVNDENTVFSAEGERGVCPPPQSSEWVEGLTAGHWCVQLKMSDGGPNDDDASINGALRDPGGVAVLQTSNSAPIAVDDQLTLPWNRVVIADVLANDSDVDGDTLNITSVNANYGIATINHDNTIRYDMQPNYSGVITISYGVSDGNGGTSHADLVLTITGNEAPVATSDEVTVKDNQTITVDVLANDTDEDNDDLFVESAQAVNGSVIVNVDNTLTYTPLTGMNGGDTVTYVISDGYDTAIGTMNVNVELTQITTAEGSDSGGSTTLWFILCSLLVWCRRYGFIVLRRSRD